MEGGLTSIPPREDKGGIDICFKSLAATVIMLYQEPRHPLDTSSSNCFPQLNNIMVNYWAIIAFGLWSMIAASPIKPSATTSIAPRSGSSNTGRCSSDCGKRNFIFTGLPWNHPAVAASGYTPKQVEAGIRADMAAIIKAGYNIKAVLLGPEDGLDFLSDELKGVDWIGTGVGFGVRGNPTPVITRRLMNIVQLYRDEYYPLSAECSNTNGTDMSLAHPNPLGSGCIFLRIPFAHRILLERSMGCLNELRVLPVQENVDTTASVATGEQEVSSYESSIVLIHRCPARQRRQHLDLGSIILIE
ncbi:uncharacterized protein CLUP02_14485 [Colletotrichum lupini]|uniref:Uncharacterized protein n=1 Tax=Colletotrichum lupini TaxID=145971 RepID=A0A9Q8WME0_9PEZI|nr:uncharacterized protein CLUP02_14485 [Colletotrichum lupini]UQC88958.1 hypothetical protein CLUP02_14485 [Colletotrichum lupini]